MEEEEGEEKIKFDVGIRAYSTLYQAGIAVKFAKFEYYFILHGLAITELELKEKSGGLHLMTKSQIR